jgi:hypothetical protein
MLRPDSLLLVLLLLLPAACATNRHFAPRENSNGQGPGGQPAAVYSFAPPASGELRLWSSGAERVEFGDGTKTRLHVGFELENTGAEPLRFDVGALRVTAVVTEAGTIPELRPVEVTGEPVAPPGGTARVDCRFDPGGSTMPRSITDFEVRWSVVMGDQVFAQATPFQTWVPWVPYWYYDPWPWYGGWYWCH